MEQLVADAVRAGAVGFATSRSTDTKAPVAVPVPSRPGDAR